MPRRPLARTLAISLAVVAGVCGATLFNWTCLRIGPYTPLAFGPGVALGALLAFGPVQALSAAVAALAAGWVAHRPPSEWLSVTLSTAAGPLLAWVLLVRVLRFRAELDRTRDALALPAAALAAGFGAALLRLPSQVGTFAIAARRPGQALLFTMLANASAMLAFAPVVATTWRARQGRAWAMPAWRPGASVLVTLALAAGVFLAPTHLALNLIWLGVGVVPLAMVIALRGSPAHAAWAVGGIVLLAVGGAAAGLGPLGLLSPGDAFQVLETLCGGLAFAVPLLAAVEQSRRRALANAIEREAQLRRALQGSGSGGWEWRRSTDRMVCDARVAALFGERPEALESVRANGERVHPDDRAHVRAALDEHLAGRTPMFEIEFRFRHRDGHDVWVLERGAVIERDADGTPLIVAGTMVDVSERRREQAERAALEERVVQAQKLESLGVLAGGVAHDFNNLLTGILGHAELARRQLEAESPAQKHLEPVVAGVRAAADLTRQMLAFAGRRSVEVRALSLPRLVREIGELLHVSVAPACTIEYALDPDAPPVAGDASQLRQLALNLIVNAAEAMRPGGGTIRVAVSHGAFDAAALPSRWIGEPLPAGRYVVLEVRDHGHGMDEETLARIFDPFFTTKFTGRGLGLAAVLGVLRAHRGGVQVESAPGSGTTFRVFLPVATAPARAAERAHAEEWRGEGLVLLVDDEPALRRVAAELLERAGFEVVTAADGREAIERFRERPGEFRLVLLDVTMPGLHGPDVARELHAIRPDVRIVLTSGYADADGGESPPPGVVAFLEKPFGPDELARVIQAALAAKAA